MTTLTPICDTPTHLITGFLGSGKTTLINALLAHKALHHAHETWGLLMNEFGKIGIDGTWLSQDNLSVREVSGGCICCNAQLPMQIGLSRLLATEPARLIIEPTGLAHAETLLGELTQSHWQSSLSLRQVICTLNSKQWQDDKYRQHVNYQAHIKYADVVVISQTKVLPRPQDIITWVAHINPTVEIILFEGINQHWQELLERHHAYHRHHTKQIAPLSFTKPALGRHSSLTSFAHRPYSDDDVVDLSLPYRYHDTLGDFIIGGWVMQNEWVFDEFALQKWLLNLPHYDRIKGVIHVTSGFISINITPFDITIRPFDGHSQNKLEMIFNKESFMGDWRVWDRELMDLIIRPTE